MSLFSKMMASTAAAFTGATPVATAAADTPPAGGAPELTEARVEQMLALTRAEGVEEGRQAGMDAERGRTSAVLNSDAGKANPSMAAFMLSANPTATADAISAQLGTMPAAATAAASAPKEDPAPKLSTDLASTPKVDLGGGGAANDGGKDPVDAEANDKLWNNSLATAAAGVRGATASRNGG